MDFSKGQKLRNKIEELKSETGLDEESVKKLFIKEYLLEGEDKSADELFSEILRGKKEG